MHDNEFTLVFAVNSQMLNDKTDPTLSQPTHTPKYNVQGYNALISLFIPSFLCLCVRGIYVAILARPNIWAPDPGAMNFTIDM